MTRRRVTIVLGLALSVVLLWWAFRDVSLSEMLGHVRAANLWLLAAATAAATGTFVLRAFRWRVLLLPVLSSSSFRSRFSAVCIGFMANNLLPARLGEFARVYAFSRTAPLGMSATFASLVVERLLDGLILLLFLIPALALVGPQTGGTGGVLRHVTVVAAVMVVAGLAVFWSMVRFPDRFLATFRAAVHRVLPRGPADRATGILASFIGGLGSLRHGRLFAQVLAWSVAVWLWNAFSFWLGFLAFGLRSPGFPGALLLQSVVGFAVSIPSSPGFFGPFEAAARLSLGGFGIDPALVVGFAAGYHVASFFPVTVLGLWYAHRLGISLREVERSDEYVEAEVEKLAEEVESAGGAEGAPAGEAGAGGGRAG